MIIMGPANGINNNEPLMILLVYLSTRLYVTTSMDCMVLNDSCTTNHPQQ